MDICDRVKKLLEVSLSRDGVIEKLLEEGRTSELNESSLISESLFLSLHVEMAFSEYRQVVETRDDEYSLICRVYDQVYPRIMEIERNSLYSVLEKCKDQMRVIDIREGSSSSSKLSDFEGEGGTGKYIAVGYDLNHLNFCGRGFEANRFFVSRNFKKDEIYLFPYERKVGFFERRDPLSVVCENVARERKVGWRILGSFDFVITSPEKIIRVILPEF